MEALRTEDDNRADKERSKAPKVSRKRELLARLLRLNVPKRLPGNSTDDTDNSEAVAVTESTTSRTPLPNLTEEQSEIAQPTSTRVNTSIVKDKQNKPSRRRTATTSHIRTPLSSTFSITSRVSSSGSHRPQRESLVSSLTIPPPSTTATSLHSQRHTTVQVSKDDPDIFISVEGLYTGSRRKYQVPQAMADEWQRSIQDRLLADLCPIQKSLPRTLTRHQTAFYPELCMAGVLENTSSIITLTPTVWIRCGSEKCMRAIKAEVDHLDYINAFSLGPVHVATHPPRLAAGRSTEAPLMRRSLSSHKSHWLPHQTSSLSAFEFAVFMPTHERAEWSQNACGLQLLIMGKSRRSTHFATVGGIVQLDGRSYALTTAHPFFLEEEFSTEEQQNALQIALNDDEVPTLEIARAGNMQVSRDQFRSHCTTQLNHCVGYHPIGVPSLAAWSFAHRASKDEHSHKWLRVSTYSDFALIDLGHELPSLRNYYVLHREERFERVDIELLDSDPSPGIVHILACAQHPTPGYLLPEPSVIADKDGIVKTRKLELNSCMKHGCSGAWVVRGQNLLGCIIAVDDYEPYVHMIPIMNTFASINQLFSIGDHDPHATMLYQGLNWSHSNGLLEEKSRVPQADALPANANVRQLDVRSAVTIADQITAQDVELAGQAVPLAPRRTPTAVSSSSQNPITISTTARFTCHKCLASSSGPRTLRFNRRNNILNQLLCDNCNALIAQFGGSGEVVSSINKKQVSSTLPPPRTVPFLSSKQESYDDGGKYGNIAQMESNAPFHHDNDHHVSLKQVTNHADLKQQRRNSTIAHRFLGSFVELLPSSWRRKLVTISGRIHEIIESKGKESVRGIEGNAVPDTFTQANFSNLLWSPPTSWSKPRCHSLGCGDEPCHCSEHVTGISIYSGSSSPCKPDPASRSQMLLGLTLPDGINWDTRVRWSMASSDMGSSIGTMEDEESGNNRLRWHPGPSADLQPARPQQPHPIAAGLHDHTQDWNVDNEFHISPRNSTSFGDD